MGGPLSTFPTLVNPIPAKVVRLSELSQAQKINNSL